jgi:hypothetical protein
MRLRRLAMFSRQSGPQLESITSKAQCVLIKPATPSERGRLDMLTGLGRDFSAGREHSLCSPAAVD